MRFFLVITSLKKKVQSQNRDINMHICWEIYFFPGYPGVSRVGRSFESKIVYNNM